MDSGKFDNAVALKYEDATKVAYENIKMQLKRLIVEALY